MKRLVTEVVFENWRYKVFALVLSTVFWVLIVDESQLATAVSVPVEYKNLPRGLEMVAEVEQTRAQLEVRGPASKLTAANLASTVVVIDLGAVDKPGEHTFPIRTSNTSLPRGVVLERAVPARVRLQFERRDRKSVPVAVRVGTNPPDGYQIVSISAEPQRITIVGPESRVRSVDTAETDPVDLADVTESGEFPVQTYVADGQVRVEGSGRVRVKVQVRQKADPKN
jgi:YbbR domain-containing protein